MTKASPSSDPYVLQIANADGIYETIQLSRRFHQEQNRELWEWSTTDAPTLFDSEAEALTIVQVIREERGGGWGVRCVRLSEAGHIPGVNQPALAQRRDSR